jgi:hypothetical protein
VKARDLIRLGMCCDRCSKKVTDSGLPLFWRVTVDRHGIDAAALQRAVGLEMLVGQPLASVMGPDEELTKQLMEPRELILCEPCGLKEWLVVNAMMKTPAGETEEG